jgi:hypothetical protein
MSEPLPEYGPVLLAQVAWMAGDIQTLRPEWSDEKCNEWLDDNEDYIQQAMIETGWEAIENLLAGEE